MNNHFIKLAVMVPALALGIAARGESLTIQAAQSLTDLGQRWVAAYSRVQPGVHLEVKAGEVAAAFNALQSQKVEVALVPRAIRFKEADACAAAFGQRPAELKVGVSGLAVFVNESNPVKELTYEDLFGVFKGKIRNWKDLGGSDQKLTTYGEETNSATAELFLDEVLNGKGWGAEIGFLSAQDLPKAIAKDVGGIGFGRLGAAAGIRALAIKRVFSSTPVEPTPETISSRIYPISRFVYCYLNPSASDDKLKTCLDWIRGAGGQQVVQEAGFYPLPTKLQVSP